MRALYWLALVSLVVAIFAYWCYEPVPSYALSGDEALMVQMYRISRLVVRSIVYLHYIYVHDRQGLRLGWGVSR